MLAARAARPALEEMIFLCQPHFESFLEQELLAFGLPASERGNGWLRTREEAIPLEELCFAHQVLIGTTEIKGHSVNSLAESIAAFFLSSVRGELIEHSWPLMLMHVDGLDGLGRRSGALKKAIREILLRRLARVTKLASPEQPRGPIAARGLFVLLTDFGRALVSRDCVFGGQRRMADDPLAPSRSYLKAEEAYVVLGREPSPGESVIDLGAAPGGWSYSAAKRGARVLAIDNGPLKGGAQDHPLIKHYCEDAFRFAPKADEVFDWLFCDLVEEPHHVLHDLITPWLSQGRCHFFVVNLKFGRVNPIAFLQQLTAPGSVLKQHTSMYRIRHLFHDREELTIVGTILPPR